MNLKPKIDMSSGHKKILRGVVGAVIVLLVAGIGLEVTENDWDLGKLLSGEESSVRRDKEGNIVESGGKPTDEYNCDDFESRQQAQRFFENAGGPNEDVNRLDGDDDALACESLPFAGDDTGAEN